MTVFMLASAVLVLGTVTVALGRLLLSAQSVDWVMAAQVLGTAGIASLLLFGIGTGRPGVIDMALLLALLAAFATVAFAARLRAVAVDSGLVDEEAKHLATAPADATDEGAGKLP